MDDVDVAQAQQVLAADLDEAREGDQAEREQDHQDGGEEELEVRLTAGEDGRDERRGQRRDVKACAASRLASSDGPGRL